MAYHSEPLQKKPCGLAAGSLWELRLLQNGKPRAAWWADDATRANPLPLTAGRFADSPWDRFVTQLNIQQPTRNIQCSRKENSALRFTRVETAKKNKSGSTSRVGCWKFLVGCWILKKWFLSNYGSGLWKKPAKRQAPGGMVG